MKAERPAELARRIGRVVFIVISFLGSFVLIEQALAAVGVSRTEANGAALMVGLVVASYVIYS